MLDGSLESKKPELEETASEYGLDIDPDFKEERCLGQDAVAATAKVQEPELEEIESYEDYLEAERVTADPVGNLYAVTPKEKTGFIKNTELYRHLDYETGEHVNLHETHHFIQYDEERLWGDVLDEEYDLSNEMREELNQVDQLMTLAEHPAYNKLVNEAEVTAVVEGYTQLITEAMQENGEQIGKPFYPQYTQIAENTLEHKGLDLEEEFGNDPQI
jgi:hypothetical protein